MDEKNVDFGFVCLTANLTVIEIVMGGAEQAEGGAKPFFIYYKI